MSQTIEARGLGAGVWTRRRGVQLNARLVAAPAPGFAIDIGAGYRCRGPDDRAFSRTPLHRPEGSPPAHRSAEESLDCRRWTRRGISVPLPHGTAQLLQ